MIYRLIVEENDGGISTLRMILSEEDVNIERDLHFAPGKKEFQIKGQSKMAGASEGRKEIQAGNMRVKVECGVSRVVRKESDCAKSIIFTYPEG